MKTQHVYLHYEPKYNVFALSDSLVQALEAENAVPMVELGAADYVRLGEKMPVDEAPVIGFLCCREEDMFSVDFNYAKSLARTGAKLRFMTYKNVERQMEALDALMLPGGRFPSPAEFYTDPEKNQDKRPLDRAQAYIICIKEAERKGLPIFGVCAGAQMLGAIHGMKLYRNAHEYTGTDIEHKTPVLEAHAVTIKAGSMLHKLLQTTQITVNSRHIEAMVNNDAESDLTIFATAPDNIPEAWGNEEKKILCIQWHQEDFAAIGNQTMQSLYDWLAKQADAYQKGKKRL
ncbi:MAG: gamma-glutamyl-gamma-aminobutyrate hydrolase family protein [Alphaproteobacteria bacterium]|nr:gamma-glutamyl-gamma-aminobutyrate hydrolase family protein [Alphaproteobacteria bacterium]